MPLVQAKFFLLANGNEPSGCKVDSATKVIAEVILWSEYPVPEEVNMMEVSIVNSDTGVCAKKFRWNGACALRNGVTYTIDTPIFGPLPVGTYSILTGFIGAPLSRTGVADCGINLSEVGC